MNRRLISLSIGSPLTGRFDQRRHLAGMAARAIARNLLKLRYWIVGGAVGGSVVLGNRYEEWKKKLPDVSWVNAGVQEQMEKWKRHWKETDLSPSNHLRMQEWNDKLKVMTTWLKSIQMGQERNFLHIASLDLGANKIDMTNDVSIPPKEPSADTQESVDCNSVDKNGEIMEGDGEISSSKMTDKELLSKQQDELLKTQSKYQRELERLEKDNKHLRQQLMLKDEQALRRHRKTKRSLIDMYSEVLDMLNEYDSSYNTTDNLPRVVVVGDQSAGKTSVLEMVAQARIFPRGSGEMMTRAPVKVTLSEGAYHTAQFRDSRREFDLTKESELRDLRQEIDVRMRNSVQDGKTVSNQVIALTVKGPGLPRMVLVDLPGVISTVTTDMAKDTKDDIAKMCRQYMENPNAIILCIQDGSVDAERSNVTDLVSSVDPAGRRTILVLTKVDLAEQNLSNPDRIKKILDGRLFPMKALGYFAVVTGKGNAQDSIDSIRAYEEHFFSQSKLFRDGVLKPTQMTTRNMSLAVSDCFWRMVRDSVEAQADAFRANRFNLETEWKNNYPRMRQLDRTELFEKAKGEILDEIVNLSQVSSQQWEEILKQRLWDTVSDHIFNDIYMPTTTVENAGSFNTQVDIKLKHWADKQLPSTSIKVGWETLREVFGNQIEQDTKERMDHDTVFDGLKEAVLEKAIGQHRWDNKALDYLHVIQVNALDDRSVPDKKSWDRGLQFMEKVIRLQREATLLTLDSLKGPGFVDRWVKWRQLTKEHQLNRHLETEFNALLDSDPNHSMALSEDDLTVVRRNLETKGVTDVAELETETIRKFWKSLYKQHFLDRALQSSRECKTFFYHYKKGFTESDIECQAVPLFWRVQKMLNLTSNALRQQIINTEQRRLEKEIKDVLEDWSQEREKKKELLVGRRVDLAEELRQVKHIQERLEEFMAALSQDKP